MAAAVFLAAALAGCGNEDSEKAHLDAPTVKEKVSQEQSAKDRGLNPNTANSMDSRPGGGKR